MNKPNRSELHATSITTTARSGTQLVRRRASPLALEQRFMFDGAAVGDAVQVLSATTPEPVLHVEAPVADASRTADLSAGLLRFVKSSMETNTTLASAQAGAERLVFEFFKRPDARKQLFTLFNGGQSEPSAQWIQAADTFLAAMRSGDISVRVELRTNMELQGAMGAFAASGPDGQPIIYLNADWVQAGAAPEAITRVLVEEIGHSIDVRINAATDTAGDEGEAFAATVLDLSLSAEERQFIASENDHDTLTIDGQTVAVEDAAITFVSMYKGTPSAWSEEAQSLNNLQPVAGTSFKFTSLDPNAPYFSGNNVAGTLTYVDGGGVTRALTGVVSRLFKTGSTIDGFYFYAYGNTLAIGDGGAGGDTAEGAYALVRAGYSASFSSGANEGTSSDPVDTALNSVVSVNSAPVLANDSTTLVEGSSATGNVLTNDTDANLDTLSVTQFLIDTNGDGVKETFAAGATANIAGVGALTIGTTGAYTFTPHTDYAGAVPVAIYTATDSKGGTATANLSISITPVNDPPISTNDAIAVAANDKTVLTTADFGTYSDVENTPLAKVQITGLPGSGSLEYYNGSAWVAVSASQEFTVADISAGKLRYTGAAPGSASLQFKVSDGTDYSVSPYSLAITINASANQSPVAVSDANNLFYVSGSNTSVTGNVLTNDTDPNGDALKVAPYTGTVTPTVTGLEARTYTTFNVGNAVGTINPGQSITGAGIPVGATILSVDNPSKTVTISSAAALTVGQAVTINTSNTISSISTLTGLSASVIAMSSLTGGSITSGMSVTSSTLTFSSGSVVANSVTSVTGGFTLVTLKNSSTNAAVTISSGTLSAGAGNDLTFTGTPVVTSVIPKTLTGTHGTLTINEDGSYVYNCTNTGVSNGATDTFNYTATDSNGGTAPATLTITIRTTSVAPVNTITGQTIVYGSSLGFATGLSVSDTNTNVTSTVLAVQHGTLVATNGGGGSLSGSGSGTITLSGTQAQINTMLQTLTYAAISGFDTGTDTLQMVTTDSTGLIDTDTINITVTTPAVTVTGTTVNEASGYVMFTVAGVIGQKVTLALGSTGTGAGFATIGDDVLPNLECYDGTTWSAYNGGVVSVPSVNGAGKLLVRVAVLQDASYEGAETLKLTATNSAAMVYGNTAGSYGTIVDNGTGTTYDGLVNGSGVPLSSASGLDDDRPLTVNSVTVNEASPYAVFTVTGQPGQVISLSLASGLATIGADTVSTLEYYNGSAWVAYNGIFVTLNGNTLLVRTAILNDVATPVYEGAENFGLVATNVSGQGFTGSGVIVDDGTGDLYPDNSTGAKDTTSPLDRDSSVSVTALGPVNEASPYAMFTVTGAAGVALELSLNNLTATLDLANASIEFYDGTQWQLYGSSNQPTAPGSSGNGTFYVRVATASEQDTAYEGAETFELIATTIATGTTLTQAASATSTLIDNGSGIQFDGTLNAGIPVTLGSINDDDRTLSVNDVSVNEASPYTVFTVTGVSGQQVKLALASTGTGVGYATLGTDTGNAGTSGPLQVLTGSTWMDYTADSYVTLSGTTLLVRTMITNDVTYEGGETFKLVATNAGGSTNALTANNNGMASIHDDGTGNLYPDNLTGATGSGALNDDRTVVAPTIAITSNTATLKAGETATLTFTLSESATDFVQGDVTVTGGALSNWTAVSGTVYTATFTPAAGRAGSGGVSVDSGKFTNAAMAANTDGVDVNNTVTMTVDTLRPTATIVIADTALKVGESSLVTITFSEAVTGFTNADLTIAHGTLSAVSSSDGGLTWTAIFTPTASIEDATNLITLDNTGVLDAAGNAGTATTDSNLYAIDTTPPTLVITSDKTALKSGETATLTFTLSESATDFVQGDVTVSGGALSNWTAVSGTVYTATFTPAGASTINGVASVTSAKFSDAAGNANVDGADTNNTVTMTVDTAVPTISIASDKTALRSGETATLTFTLSESATNFVVGDVTVAGGTLSNFTGSGTTYTATFTPSTGSIVDGTVNVSVTQFTDAASNDNTASNTVTLTVDTVLVTVSSPSVNEASPYAVFSVSGVAGQSLSLVLAGGSATSAGTDFGGAGGTNLEYSLDGGSTWIANSVSPNPTLIGSTMLVRTPIIEDGISDNNETFTLTATPAGGTPAVGTGTIKDDGTGAIYRADGSENTSAPKSDDRALTVSSPSVNEASPYAVFVITGQAGQKMSLALESDAAIAGVDTGSTLQYFDGTVWQDYAAGSLVSIPNGRTTLLVRTAIVNDALFEGSESFRLMVSNTGGLMVAGTATIKDDGSNAWIFAADNTSGVATMGDANDDRPKPVVFEAPVVVPSTPVEPAAAVPALAEPVTAPALVFNSAILVTTPSTLPMPDKTAPIVEVLTSRSGFQIVVAEAATPSLSVFRGITDQFVEGSKPSTFAMPYDTFVHTRPDATVTLVAKLTNGLALPAWVQFDARSGTFQLNPPPGFSDDLQIKVIARDSEGREASVIFRFSVGDMKAKTSGRSGLSEQIRLAAQRSSPLFDLGRPQSGKALPVSPRARV